jgi:hypothetical protein
MIVKKVSHNIDYIINFQIRFFVFSILLESTNVCRRQRHAQALTELEQRTGPYGYPREKNH